MIRAGDALDRRLVDIQNWLNNDGRHGNEGAATVFTLINVPLAAACAASYRLLDSPGAGVAAWLFGAFAVAVFVLRLTMAVRRARMVKEMGEHLASLVELEFAERDDAAIARTKEKS